MAATEDNQKARRVAALTPHPKNEEIYGDRDELDDEFLDSIDEHGIITPVVITTDDTIISGHRRVAAAGHLGIREVPVRVQEFEDELAARLKLVESNRQREKSFSQRMREAEEIEAIERERARRRQGDRTDVRDNCPGGDDVEYGRARDKIADKAGFGSGKTYQRAREVWDAAKEGDQIAQHEVDRLDREKSSVYGAWKSVCDRGSDGEGGDSASDPTETLTADDLILSAHRATSDEVFPKILRLHVERGAVVADVTYGNGTFWRQVPTDEYDLRATDLDPDRSPSTAEGVDYRDLPYGDGEIDAVVLDPPYAEGFYDGARSADESDFWIKGRYANAADGDLQYHEAVLNEYAVAGREARRVLAADGVLIAKLQDEVSRNEQRLTHIEVTNIYEEELGFDAEDLFVLVRQDTPTSPNIKRQRRARKNHSYFMVFEA